MSPAIASLKEAFRVGRAARINVIFDGRLQASVLGPAACELFDTVILARFSADTWQILAPDVGPAPN
ncbi:hypothetical protein [Streptomyces sp. NPDC058011]|uniref:hypothetical protein n=1 Tax=Streptomyces sp. NPDC058011 TaxID=3346305 RepID=UPI0036E1B69D